MIRKVVSGGQTGADLGGLFAARDLGLETGGWAPRGWRTERGSDPGLSAFGLVECAQDGYPARTGANVRDSDLTLIFGNQWSPGCQLTMRYCGRFERTAFYVDWPFPRSGYRDQRMDALRDDVLRHPAWGTLNVAGNRESRNPGIQEACRAFVREVLGG